MYIFRESGAVYRMPNAMIDLFEYQKGLYFYSRASNEVHGVDVKSVNIWLKGHMQLDESYRKGDYAFSKAEIELIGIWLKSYFQSTTLDEFLASVGQ